MARPITLFTGQWADLPFEEVCRLAADWGYDGLTGPISVEWEDAGMNRLIGAPEALMFVRRLAFDPPSASFDAAFAGKDGS